MGAIDGLLENDTFAAIGGALVCVIGWVVVGMNWAPGHEESVGSIATAAGAFSLAAMRRAGNAKRRQLDKS